MTVSCRNQRFFLHISGSSLSPSYLFFSSFLRCFLFSLFSLPVLYISPLLSVAPLSILSSFFMFVSSVFTFLCTPLLTPFSTFFSKGHYFLFCLYFILLFPFFCSPMYISFPSPSFLFIVTISLWLATFPEFFVLLLQYVAERILGISLPLFFFHPLFSFST